MDFHEVRRRHSGTRVVLSSPAWMARVVLRSSAARSADGPRTCVVRRRQSDGGDRCWTATGAEPGCGVSAGIDDLVSRREGQ